VVIGAAAPPGTRILAARLARPMPANPIGEPVAVDVEPVVTSLDQGPGRDVAWFEAPGGRAWPPGVYVVALETTSPAGGGQLLYATTLLPGSARSTSVPLAAARTWSRFAGAWGVAAGLVEPLDGPARLAVRYAAQTPEPVSASGADFSRRCLEVNIVDTATPILGLTHPFDQAPDAIRLERVYLDGTASLPAPSVARSVVPGLTIVAAGEGTAWPPGWYRLVIRTGDAAIALPVCVGEVGGTLLRVPPGAGSRG
jgi:hypothetical protein